MQSVCAPESKRGRPKIYKSMTRYPPVVGAPLDQTSLEKHQHKIKVELEKENPKKQILLPLMEQTYLARREMILSEGVSISHILDIYPCLKLFSVVSTFKNLLVLMCDSTGDLISFSRERMLSTQVWRTGKLEEYMGLSSC